MILAKKNTNLESMSMKEINGYKNMFFVFHCYEKTFGVKNPVICIHRMGF